MPPPALINDPVDIDQLRTTLRMKRRHLSAAQQQQASQALAHQVAKLKIFRQATTIAGYLAADGEIDPLPILHLAHERGKQCLVPVLDPQQNGMLLFAPWAPNISLQKNRFGISEPQWHKAQCIAASNIDLTLVPLVGFDAAANRLGMGGGFYDRTFAFRKTLSKQQPPILLGIAHGIQKVDGLLVQAWDVPLNAVATGNNFYQR